MATEIAHINKTKKYAFMGCNDDASFCSVCGKKELKRVVWLCNCDGDGQPDGYAFPVGTSCAARMLGWHNPTSTSTKNKVLEEAKKALRARRQKFIDDYSETAVVTGITRGFNKFNCPNAIIIINGEDFEIAGRGPYGAEGTDEELSRVACRKFAAQKCPF